MNLLVDTHAFLWFIASDPRLSTRAQSLIQDPGNRRLFSMAGLWEIAIKVSRANSRWRNLSNRSYPASFN